MGRRLMVADRLPEFGCQEYLAAYKSGRYDPRCHFWFILKFDDIEIGEDGASLVIGRPGVDGIQFCYRAGLDGIWAYYPIFGEWKRAAATVAELETGWLSGAISV